MNHIAYTLIVRVPAHQDDPEGIRRLRGILKHLWRAWGVRCVDVRPAKDEACTASMHRPEREPTNEGSLP